MKRSALAVGLGTGLTLFIASVWNAERRQRRLPAGTPRKMPLEQVHTWEGEGGNLAGVAPPTPPQETHVHSRSTH